MSTPGQKPTVKQQRAAQREEKLAEFRKQQAAKKRTKKIAIGAAIAVGVAVIATVAIVVTVGLVNAGAPKPQAELGTVETWDDLDATHTNKNVNYQMDPPAGGPHNPVWLNCGVYDQPVKNENAVHDLEHGAVWVTYDPDAVSGDELDALKAALPIDQGYVTLSPYPDLDAPMAISAWGAQLKFDDPADEKLADFIETYWRSADAPEPGASCTGGVGEPTG